MIKKIWSKRLQDWGYKADIGLGTGTARRRVRLPSEGVFASEPQCRNAVAQARAEFAKGEFSFAADREAATIQTLFDAWIERQHKWKFDEGYIRMAERTFEIFGQQVLARDSNIEALTSDHLGEYYTLRQKQDAMPQTAFKELRQILAALNNAGNVKGLEGWTPPRKPDWIVRGKGKEKRAITREEERLILTDLRLNAQTDMADLIVMGIYAGLRKSEISRIDRADIQDERALGEPFGTLTARTTKTGQFRQTGQMEEWTFPIVRRIRRLLDRRRENWDPQVTPTMPATGPLFPKFNYKRELKECCERVGVLYGQKTPGGITFHNTRHTFITRHRERGTRPEVIQKLVGQRTLSVTLGYSHVTASDLGDAMDDGDNSEE